MILIVRYKKLNIFAHFKI